MENNIHLIGRLVDYIDEHLAEPLDLDSLAHWAGYSKYHLHRIFSGVVGFPPHHYIRRRRLTEAARMLACSDTGVMEIALSAGYETQQAFTTAFGAQFNVSPREFRKRRDFYPFQLKFQVDGKQNLRGDMIMNVRIVESGKLTLAGFKANTAGGFAVIGGCWAQLNQVKRHIPDRIDPDTVIALDDYSVNMACGTPPAFDYYAAVEVSSLSNIPPGLTVKELPAGRHVVFSYKGCPRDSMQPVVEYIYNEWFPQSTARLKDDGMYDFAKLSETLDEEGKGEVEFWVPIL